MRRVWRSSGHCPDSRRRWGMSAEFDSAEELLASILDGNPPDWDTAEREIGAGRKTWLDSLRGVSRIAAYHRDLQRKAAALALASGVRIGTYELVAFLGVCGIGEDYR